MTRLLDCDGGRRAGDAYSTIHYGQASGIDISTEVPVLVLVNVASIWNVLLYARVAELPTGLGSTTTTNAVVSFNCKNERTVDFFILFDCFGR